MRRLHTILVLCGLALTIGAVSLSITAGPLSAVATTSPCDEENEEDAYCNCDDLETPNKICSKSAGVECVFDPPAQCSTACDCYVTE